MPMLHPLRQAIGGQGFIFISPFFEYAKIGSIVNIIFSSRKMIYQHFLIHFKACLMAGFNS